MLRSSGTGARSRLKILCESDHVRRSTVVFGRGTYR